MRNELNAGLEVAIHDRAMLAELLPDWRRLCAHSLEDNVYYAPSYAMALLETVERRADPRFVTVRYGKELVALLPAVVNRLGVVGLTLAGGAWRSDYTFGCLPLIHRDWPVQGAMGLLDGLAKLKRGDWIIPGLNQEGPVCRALIEALDECNVPWIAGNSFERASLAAGKSFEDHMKEHVSKRRQKQMARRRRHLDELGAVVLESHRSGPGLSRAVDAFLAIEAGGWKGRRGTALACRPDTRAFAERAFKAENACRADLLTLDGKPIAAGLTVFAGGTGFTVKWAYDEAYAPYGPGVLLDVELLKSFLSERWAERLDAATDGANNVDLLWPDRVKVGDLLFSFAATMPRRRLMAYRYTQGQLARVKALLKRLLRRSR